MMTTKITSTNEENFDTSSAEWEQILNDQVILEQSRLASALQGKPLPPSKTVSFAVAITKNSRATGAALKLLSSMLPLPDSFNFLKRVRRVHGSETQLLLAPISDEQDIALSANVYVFLQHLFTRAAQEQEQQPQQQAKHINEIFAKQGKVIQVPAIEPLCGEEAREWSKEFWPVLSGQRTTMTSRRRALSPVPLDASQSKSAREWLDRAIELSKANGGRPAGIVVDHASGTLVAQGVDQCHLAIGSGGGHPLRHATMLAIDAASCAILAARTKIKASVAGSASQGRDRQKRQKTHEKELAQRIMVFFDPVNTYLLTGLDFYVSHEPCTMCAMALLHSRTSRVFYARPCPSNGALGSKLSLHCNPTLNHHFMVYRLKVL